jgi:hypothetical protein
LVYFLLSTFLQSLPLGEDELEALRTTWNLAVNCVLLSQRSVPLRYDDSAQELLTAIKHVDAAIYVETVSNTKRSISSWHFGHCPLCTHLSLSENINRVQASLLCSGV